MGGSANDGRVEGCGEVCGFASMDCSGEWKEILLIAQSINGLLWVSQLCPRTRKQEPSSGVTKNDVRVREGNCLSDCAVHGSIEKMEFERRDGVGGK